jgi:uncharacterized protein (UPF0297 family)
MAAKKDILKLLNDLEKALNKNKFDNFKFIFGDLISEFKRYEATYQAAGSSIDNDVKAKILENISYIKMHLSNLDKQKQNVLGMLQLIREKINKLPV